MTVRAKSRSQSTASCSAGTKASARGAVVVAGLVANARSARDVLTGGKATGGTDARVLAGGKSRANTRVLAGGEARANTRAVVTNTTLKTARAAASGELRVQSPLSDNSGPLLVVRVQRRSRSIAVMAGGVIAAQDAAGARVSVVRAAAGQNTASAGVRVAARQDAARRAGVGVVRVAAGQDAASAARVRVATRQNATGRAGVRVAARQNAGRAGVSVVGVTATQDATRARVRVVTRQNAASAARVGVVVAAGQNATGRAVVRVATGKNATGRAGVRVVGAATQDTASSALSVAVAATQNATSARVSVVRVAVTTQNATCGRRVRRVRADSGAESRLLGSVRGCVGRGAVVPSETDVAEDRGDYATFFVGCVVVVSVVVEGVVVAAAAGEGVGRHDCSCVLGGVVFV